MQDRLRRLETGGVIAGYDVRLAVETRPGVRATIMLAIDLRLQDRLAFLHLTLDDMRAAGAMPGETGGLTDFTQTLATTVVSALITEVPAEHRSGDTSKPLVKISLRSKSEPVGVDVNRVAQTLGGGGHVRAAGAKMYGTIDDAKREIERLVGEQLG